MKINNRVEHLDLGCGILIIWMIYGHLLGLLNMLDSPFYIYPRYVLGFFMPWFFYKSGMFHKEESGVKSIIRGGAKLKRYYNVWGVIGLIIGLVCNSGFYHQSIITFFKSEIYSIIINAAPVSNLPLWFLISLFLTRMLSIIIKKKYILFTILFLTIMGFMFSDFRSIHFISSVLSGIVFYNLGRTLKEIQYDRYVLIISIFLLVVLSLFCFTYVGMRENIVVQGNYFLWPIQSIASIVCFNNVTKIINNKYLDSNFCYMLRFVGKYSMWFYVSHWPIILLSINFVRNV